MTVLDPVDALEAELMRAATRLTSASSPRPKRGRRRLVGGLLAAVLVSAPAVAAVTETWPGGGMPDEGANQRVQIPVSGENASKLLTEAFAVLREPRSEEDRLPSDASVVTIASGLQLDAARLLTRSAEGRSYLVPVEHLLPVPAQARPEGAVPTGPPGLCVATVGQAVELPCVAVESLFNEGGGLLAQTAVCAPALATGTVSVEVLAADAVSQLRALTQSGEAISIEPRGNLATLTIPLTDPVVRLQWVFGNRSWSRNVAPAAAPNGAACVPASAVPDKP